MIIKVLLIFVKRFIVYILEKTKNILLKTIKLKKILN